MEYFPWLRKVCDIEDVYVTTTKTHNWGFIKVLEKTDDTITFKRIWKGEEVRCDLMIRAWPDHFDDMISTMSYVKEGDREFIITPLDHKDEMRSYKTMLDRWGEQTYSAHAHNRMGIPEYWCKHVIKEA
jgi:hypothetical protein